MKPILLTLALCLACIGATGQSAIDREIDKMAEKLVRQLNNLKSVKRVGVADFTFLGQPNTRIGKYVADRLSNKLLENGLRARVQDREVVRSALTGGMASARSQAPAQPLFNQQTGQNIQSLTDKEATTEQKTEAAFNEALNLFDWLRTRPSNPLKDTDALLYGEIEEMGDNLIITARAVENDKRADKVGFAEAIFVITPEVRTLIGSAPPPPPPVQDITRQPGWPITPTPPLPPSPPSDIPPFKWQHLTFEIRGCSQTGSEVECKFTVFSDKQDTDLWMHFNGTRFWNANGGEEFGPVEMAISDVSGTSHSVGKWIIAGNSVGATIRFGGVSKNITSMSLLNMNCRDEHYNNFHVQFRNVPVR